jgi:hypothetical protein
MLYASKEGRAKQRSAWALSSPYQAACKPKYMFARQTTEPRRTAQTMVLGVTALATSAREMSGGALVG